MTNKAGIERSAFVEAMRALERRFNHEIHEDDLSRYHEYLSERMDTDEFLAAVDNIWATNRFFPRPADFLTIQIEDAWRRLKEAASIGIKRHANMTADGEPVRWTDPLTPRGIQAIRDLGGIESVQELLNFNAMKLKAEWRQVYENVATFEPATYRLANVEPEAIEAGDDGSALPLGWEGVEPASSGSDAG